MEENMDFPEDTDIVTFFLKDKNNQIIFIQEQSESEDGNSEIRYYFNTNGLLFSISINSFHFENPCIDNKIRDLTYVQNIYFNNAKMVNREEYIVTSNKIKMKLNECTFNGNTKYKDYKNIDIFKSQNQKLFSLLFR